MATHTFDTRSSEWLGDMTVWLRDNANTNSELLTRLRQNLRRHASRSSLPAAAGFDFVLRPGNEYDPDRPDSGCQLFYCVQNHPPGQSEALPLSALLPLICTFSS